MPPSGPRLPVTPAQYGIWVAQQVDVESPGYLTAEVVELEGALDTAALVQSVQEVLDHCDALHMRFEWDGDALWQHPQPACTQVQFVDLSAQADPTQAARDWMRTSLRVSCDLRFDALYRTALLRLSPQCHWWYLQVHHVALDGFGYSLLQQTVAVRYNARVAGAPLPPMPDWTLERVLAAEAQYREDGRFDADRAFWREHLHDLPPPAHLAPRQPPGDTPLRHTLALALERAGRLQAAAQNARVEWTAWMLAAIGLWLGRQSGQRHLTLGLPVMNRLGTPAMGVPCMAMNIVPLCVHIDPESAMQAMAAQMAAQLRAIRPHLRYRYGWIRGDLGLLDHDSALFDQAVNLMPFDRQVAFASLASRMQPVSGGPVKDLNLSLVVSEDAWQLTLEANPRTYEPARVAALAGDLGEWLDALAGEAPGAPLAHRLHELPRLSVCDGAPLAGPLPDVMALLREAAARCPGHTAIEKAGERLDYQGLLAQVERSAAALALRGVGRHDRVAVLLPRSPEAVTAALAVLWVGAVYVPLDPEGPPQRTAALLADAALALVLTRAPWRRLAGALPVLDLDADGPEADAREAVACHSPQPQDPAYLLYTSGSTGQPKGVLVGHGALAHFVASTRALYGVGPADRVLQFAPLHFDASLEEIFVTLCHGATLVLRDEAMLDSTAAFAAAVERLDITVLDLPTAYWHVLAHALDAEAARALGRVRLTIIGGEAALPERVARWRDGLPAQVLLNTYGPTEAGIIATTARLGGPQAVWTPGEAVPIGLPRPGVQACVVDERLYAVAEGVAGELVLCGDALALGYLDDAPLTGARFVHLPGTGRRAYRTGDRVCLQEGQLRFLGRMDDQVKISGLRIDPLEIENLLSADAVVREAAVLPLQRGPGGWALAAFIVGTQDTRALRARLAQQLPAPAVPDVWQVLAQLPRNPNGKVDRRALARRMAPQDAPAPAHDMDTLEGRVMQAWREVLGEVALSATSNFFELGGKSLQAFQVSSQLTLALQRDVPVSMLFRHATLQSLVQALALPMPYRRPAAQDPFAPLLTLQAGAADAPVLFCFHPAEGLAWSYLRLLPYLPGVTVHGLQMDPASTRTAPDFDALVDGYLRRVRALQPEGPYHLLGWSLGGALAHGVAARLAWQGEAVGLLALMDSYPVAAWCGHTRPRLNDALKLLLSVGGDFETDGFADEALRERLLRPGSPFAPLGPRRLDAFAHEALRLMQLFRDGSTPRYDGELLLFEALRKSAGKPRSVSWLPHLRAGALQCHALDCSHEALSDPAPMAAIGAALARRLSPQGADVTVSSF